MAESINKVARLTEAVLLLIKRNFRLGLILAHVRATVTSGFYSLNGVGNTLTLEKLLLFKHVCTHCQLYISKHTEWC